MHCCVWRGIQLAPAFHVLQVGDEHFGRVVQITYTFRLCLQFLALLSISGFQPFVPAHSLFQLSSLLSYLRSTRSGFLFPARQILSSASLSLYIHSSAFLRILFSFHISAPSNNLTNPSPPFLHFSRSLPLYSQLRVLFPSMPVPLLF